MLADRTKARVFELSDDKITELQDFFNELSRHGKSDGFAGYDAGHAERRVSNEAAQHFKAIADYLKERYEREAFNQLLIGCHDEQWPEIEPHLHTSEKQKLIGHFRVDPKVATPEQVKEMAAQKIAEHEREEKQRLIGDVVGEAHRNGNGAIGLRRVLRSLETGEVQTLLLGSNFQASGVKCYHCGHMDLGEAADCSVCGKPNTQARRHRRRYCRSRAAQSHRHFVGRQYRGVRSHRPHRRSVALPRRPEHTDEGGGLERLMNLGAPFRLLLPGWGFLFDDHDFCFPQHDCHL